MKQNPISSGLFFSLTIGLLLFLSHCSGKPPESRSAPDFTLKTLSNQEIRLSSLKGKVVLLDFWATWCAPCKESIPHLVDLYKKFHDQGFELIGMSTDKSGDAEMVRRFVQSMDIPYLIIMTPDEITKKYKVTGLPTTILIDRKGNIREKMVGFNTAIGQKISNKISELTREKP